MKHYLSLSSGSPRVSRVFRRVSFLATDPWGPFSVSVCSLLKTLKLSSIIATYDDELEDIRLEEMVEVIYQQLLASVPSDVRGDCPVLKRIGAILLDIKEVNSSEIAAELGIVLCRKNKCPCQARKALSWK